MNRLPIPNPDADGYELFRLQLSSDELAAWFGKTGIADAPPGYTPYVALIGNMLTIGIRRAGTVTATAKSDNYDKMSDADLRARCGMKGIACGDEDNRTALLAKLRAKK